MMVASPWIDADVDVEFARRRMLSTLSGERLKKSLATCNSRPSE